MRFLFSITQADIKTSVYVAVRVQLEGGVLSFCVSFRDLNETDRLSGEHLYSLSPGIGSYWIF